MQPDRLGIAHRLKLFPRDAPPDQAVLRNAGVNLHARIHRQNLRRTPQQLLAEAVPPALHFVKVDALRVVVLVHRQSDVEAVRSRDPAHRGHDRMRVLVKHAVQIASLRIRPHVVPQAPRIQARENKQRHRREPRCISLRPTHERLGRGRLVAVDSRRKIQPRISRKMRSLDVKQIKAVVLRERAQPQSRRARDATPASDEVFVIVGAVQHRASLAKTGADGQRKISRSRRRHEAG